MDIRRLLQFIERDTAEAMGYLVSGNFEMIFRLCECIAEQAEEIKQIIDRQEKGE